MPGFRYQLWFSSDLRGRAKFGPAQLATGAELVMEAPVASCDSSFFRVQAVEEEE